MRVGYGTHESFRRHQTGAWHPERPERLAAVEAGVFGSGLEIETVVSPVVDRETLERVHPAAYIDAVERFCRAGGGPLDPDTVVSEDSWEAALRSAGAGPDMVELQRSRSVDLLGFCAVRPPGHHACASKAMGFCIFNNAVVTARALTAQGLRVAIVDWDVHHGNGTQELVVSDPEVLYVSLHQHPFYPFEGMLEETGEPPAIGATVNLPLPAGTGGDVYSAAFERVVMPVLGRFEPDWLLVSAGFDAHEDDPLAELRLVSSDYGRMAARICAEFPPGQTTVFLEGGYHLPALELSVASMLRGFAGQDVTGESRTSPDTSWLALDRASDQLAQIWGI